MDRYKVIPMDTWSLSLLIWWCQVRQRDWLGHVFTVTIVTALQKDIPQTVSSKYCQVKIQILEKIRSLIRYNLLSGYFDSLKHKRATRYFLREPKFIRCHLAGLSWLAQWLGRKFSPPGTVTSQGSQGLTQPVWLGTTVVDPEPSVGDRPSWHSGPVGSGLSPDLGYSWLLLHQATLSAEGSAHCSMVKFDTGHWAPDLPRNNQRGNRWKSSMRA